MKGDHFDSYKQELIQLNKPANHQFFLEGEAGDATLGLKVQMKGNHFDTYKQELIQLNKDGEGEEGETEKPAKKKQPVLESEKVSILDPKIAKSHTTFYNRQ